MSIASQSADNSSIFSSPTSSSSTVTSLMSLSQTYPCKLHTPRHMSVHVDWTERWLQMCERRRWPLLKVRSTLTEVAVMGPTRPWVWSCWIEEIREPAEEELQKLQRINCILAGVAWIARIATSQRSHKMASEFSILRFVIYHMY